MVSKLFEGVELVELVKDGESMSLSSSSAQCESGDTAVAGQLLGK